jgi:hypothetical protein
MLSGTRCQRQHRLIISTVYKFWFMTAIQNESTFLRPAYTIPATLIICRSTIKVPNLYFILRFTRISDFFFVSRSNLISFSNLILNFATKFYKRREQNSNCLQNVYFITCFLTLFKTVKVCLKLKHLKFVRN